MTEVTITRSDHSDTNNQIINLGEDDTSGVVDTVLDMGRHDPENPIPHTEQSGHPDAGFSGLRLRISVVISDTEIIKKLRDWLRQSQTTDSFEYGRFSLDHKIMPGFNLTAQTTAGYKIINVHLEVNHQMPHWKTGYIILQLDGDAGKLV